MRRREFIALLGGAAAAWPVVARAQERVRKIGVLMGFAENDADAQVWIKAFEGELQKLGWQQSRNLSIDLRWPGVDADRLQAAAKEMVSGKPDVILAGSTIAAVPLMKATQTLPIVFVQVSDPVKLGLVSNLARPNGNLTGFVNFEHAIGGKWLELIRDTAPGVNRVAVIHDPDNISQAPYVQAVEASAPSFGVQVTRAGVRDAAEIERAINAFANPKGALIVVPSGLTITNRASIVALANRYRLPAVYPYRLFASEGGFVSYGVDLAELYRGAAGYVDRILRGAKPAELPVQLPTKYELVVNLKTAKALGLTVPVPFLQRADEVIE